MSKLIEALKKVEPNQYRGGFGATVILRDNLGYTLGRGDSATQAFADALNELDEEAINIEQYRCNRKDLLGLIEKGLSLDNSIIPAKPLRRDGSNEAWAAFIIHNKSEGY